LILSYRQLYWSHILATLLPIINAESYVTISIVLALVSRLNADRAYQNLLQVPYHQANEILIFSARLPWDSLRKVVLTGKAVSFNTLSVIYELFELDFPNESNALLVVIHENTFMRSFISFLVNSVRPLEEAMENLNGISVFFICRSIASSGYVFL
jgi:hypothetical protein